MAGTNKVFLVGTLDRDPESRTFNNGGSVVNLRVETSETWSDRSTGEQRERRNYHSVSVFTDDGKAIAEHGRKGDWVLVEGALQTRKYTDNQGVDKWVTEVVVQLRGHAELLDHRTNGAEPRRTARPAPQRPGQTRIEDDKIPWMDDPPSMPA